jgi:hypothetical protein
LGVLNRTGIDLWGVSDDLAAIALKRCLKARDKIGELREENRKLRELVAHLSELALTRITESSEPEEAGQY